jgi:aminopeptidase N
VSHRLAILILVLAGCGGARSASDASPSADANPPIRPEPAEDRARDILSYDLTLDLEQDMGIAEIEVAAAPSEGLTLEVGNLEIGEVSDSQGPLKYRIDGDLMHVGVPADEDLAITIEYSFQPHTNFDGWMEDRGVTFLWPYFCHNLFPCKSDPSDGATFKLAVAGSSADSALFPEIIPSDAPSYMPAIAVGSYTQEVLGNTTSGTEVSVYYLPGQQVDALAGTAHLTGVLDFYEQTYGAYSFGDKVGTVSANWGGGDFGGMEHHPLWHVSSGSLYSEEVNAHEAAHGWFGNGVRIACWEDFVLSEGLATYLAARALAEQGVDIWPKYECNLKTVCTGSSNTIALPGTCGDIDLLNHPLWSSVPYQKGAFFLAAVAEVMGETELDAALADFYSQHVGQAASMQDLLDLLGARSDSAAIDGLAEEWLRRENCPVSTATFCL